MIVALGKRRQGANETTSSLHFIIALAQLSVGLRHRSTARLLDATTRIALRLTRKGIRGRHHLSCCVSTRRANCSQLLTQSGARRLGAPQLGVFISILVG